MDAALSTLAAADQQDVTQAQLEYKSWVLYAHAQPLPDPHNSGRHLIDQLRRMTLTAAFSHFAYSTMMDHLSGQLPLDDWDTVRLVRTRAWWLIQER